MVADCIFCSLPKMRVVFENDLAVAIFDGYPVTEGHSLVIPKRHVADFFDLENVELEAIFSLLKDVRTLLSDRDSAIRGFNVGVNAGAVAGQTVMHCHVHLIPRRVGDVPDPRGGVRHLIPGKGFYPQDASGKR